jgi:aldose 1-epimerase
METLILENGSSRLELLPEIGGAIARYRTDLAERSVDWMRPASDEGRRGDILELSCFPLVPFSGRIRNGRFRFAGCECELPLNFPPAKHTIHGHGWHGSWEVEGSTRRDARLGFRHRADQWPWSYLALQTFVLGEEELTVTLEVENTSDAPMPAGIGLHPYFPRTPRTRITARCEKMWITDEEMMPIELSPLTPEKDLRSGFEPDSGFVDNTFAGWNRRAHIEWPEWGATMEIEAGEPLDYLVVYAPLDGDFFCVEPVSNVADAFNMMARGEADHGTRVLQPAETLTGTTVFRHRLGQ